MTQTPEPTRPPTPELPAPAQPPAAPQPLKDRIIEALRNVYDPEIPINIYDLGLIYDVQVDPSNKVDIKMTLTSPACPVAQSLPLEVRATVSRIPEVSACEVDLVFDPPWNPNKMSDEAKLKLGLL